jgi:hypothetical protein
MSSRSARRSRTPHPRPDTPPQHAPDEAAVDAAARLDIAEQRLIAVITRINQRLRRREPE